MQMFLKLYSLQEVFVRSVRGGGRRLVVGLAALAALATALQGVGQARSGSSHSSVPYEQPEPPTPPQPPLPRPQGRLVPAQGALFGIHTTPDASNAKKPDDLGITRMEADFGRTFDIDNKYYLWEAKFPTWRDQYDVQSGRIPMISWGGGDTIQIQRGKYDALIDERAASIKALGAPLFLRWFWEADGTRKSKASVSHSANDFIKAWRHIRARFDQAGVTNAVWVWCPVSLDFYPPPRGLNPAQPYYPGDDVVDWICADGYNWAPGKRGTPYQSFQSLFEAFYAFGNEHHKPLMVGETGVQENNAGDKTNWIKAMHQSVINHYPNIVAFCYFDVDDSGNNGNYDWRLTSTQDAVGAFRDMALDPYFNQPHATLSP
jgi:hypothetical protein